MKQTKWKKVRKVVSNRGRITRLIRDMGEFLGFLEYSISSLKL